MCLGRREVHRTIHFPYLHRSCVSFQAIENSADYINSHLPSAEANWLSIRLQRWGPNTEGTKCFQLVVFLLNLIREMIVGALLQSKTSAAWVSMKFIIWILSQATNTTLFQLASDERASFQVVFIQFRSLEEKLFEFYSQNLIFICFFIRNYFPSPTFLALTSTTLSQYSQRLRNGQNLAKCIRK